MTTKKEEYLKFYNHISGTAKKTIYTKPQSKEKKNERTVLQECKSYLLSLQSYRVIVQRNNTGFGDLRGTGHCYSYGIKYAADLICLIDGKYVEIECKHGKGGKWSVEQQQHAEEVRRNGGYYFIVHSKQELAEKIKPLLPNIFKELENQL